MAITFGAGVSPTYTIDQDNINELQSVIVNGSESIFHTFFTFYPVILIFLFCLFLIGWVTGFFKGLFDHLFHSNHDGYGVVPKYFEHMSHAQKEKHYNEAFETKHLFGFKR